MNLRAVPMHPSPLARSAIIAWIGVMTILPASVRPGFAADPSAAGFALPTLVIVNDNNLPLPARTVSFGQVFAEGLVGPQTRLEALVDGQPEPAQLDVKARHDDGSVRHAIVTMAVPPMAPRQRLAVELEKTSISTGASKEASPFALPAVDVTLSLKGGAGGVRTISVILPTLEHRKDAQAASAWIEGPLAREIRFRVSATPALDLFFDVWVPATGPSRVDISFHRDWSDDDESVALEYDVEIHLGHAIVYEAQNVHHYAFATWHHVVWTDGLRPPRIIPSLESLIAAGAVPRYAPQLRPDRLAVDDLYAALRSSNTKPLGAALIERHMPNTGGRMDIGPLPLWAVDHLLAGLSATQDVLLANADAAGSIPWHLRDRRTGLALNLEDHPSLWLDPRGKAEPGVLAKPFDNEQSGWTIDNAHQPSLTYLPYLLTASQYYGDELAQQAAYLLLSYDPGYRGEGKALFIGVSGEAWVQVRGLAWSLRTLANAAYILPDSYPLKDLFQSRLHANLHHLVTLYVQQRRLAAAGMLEGWIPGDNRTEEATAPWQQDFQAAVLDWINDMGYGEAGKLLDWMSNFLTGRFTRQKDGFDPLHGVAYALTVMDPGKGSYLSSWKAAFDKSNLAHRSQRDTDEDWRDYGGAARAALAGVLTVTRNARASEAYRYVVQHTPELRWGYAKDPTFAIVPRAADGRLLSLTDLPDKPAPAGPKF
jgi:hypothetical protein